MPKPSSSVANEVTSRARGLDYSLKRIEQLHRDGQVRVHDVERAYAGGFLEFYVTWNVRLNVCF